MSGGRVRPVAARGVATKSPGGHSRVIACPLATSARKAPLMPSRWSVRLLVQTPLPLRTNPRQKKNKYPPPILGWFLLPGAQQSESQVDSTRATK